MKNVLFLAYYFPPLGGSGVQRPLKFVKYLRNFGWNPIVVCPEPGAYPYYDSSLLEELNDLSVDVYRASAQTPFHFPFVKSKKLVVPEKVTRIGRQISRLFMYPDNKRGWINQAVNTSLEIAKEQNFDLIFSTAPPFSDHLAATEIKKELGLPVVLDYRDAWVNNHFIDDQFEWQKKIHRKLESSCLSDSDQVIVLDEKMEASLKSEYPEISFNTHVISHGFDPDDFKGTDPPILEYKTNKMNLLYSGLFYENNQPDILLKAFEELILESRIGQDEFHLHFQGGLSGRHKRLIEELGLSSSVTDYGYLTHNIAVSNLNRADALWMISNFDPVHKQIKSGKLFEYIGSGKPILGLTHIGSESEVLKAYGAGYVAAPDDLNTVKESIMALFTNWKQNKIKVPDQAYVQQFDRKKLTKELAKVFDTLSYQ